MHVQPFPSYGEVQFNIIQPGELDWKAPRVVPKETGHGSEDPEARDPLRHRKETGQWHPSAAVSVHGICARVQSGSLCGR